MTLNMRILSPPKELQRDSSFSENDKRISRPVVDLRNVHPAKIRASMVRSWKIGFSHWCHLISPKMLPGPSSASTSLSSAPPTTATSPLCTMYISLPISPYKQQNNNKQQRSTHISATRTVPANSTLPTTKQQTTTQVYTHMHTQTGPTDDEVLL